MTFGVPAPAQPNPTCGKLGERGKALAGSQALHGYILESVSGDPPRACLRRRPSL